MPLVPETNRPQVFFLGDVRSRSDEGLIAVRLIDRRPDERCLAVRDSSRAD